jgi:AcrR family transcriptional regulator
LSEVATHVEQEAAPRIPLSRRRVFQAAVKLADAHGIEALTMRRLAEELGAEAMSLYHHVANKEQVLDGVVEVVAGEINDAVDRVGAEVAKPADWKGVVRRRILAAREVMLRHKWAPSVFESRTNMNPEVLRYHDQLVGIMHAGGFTYDQIHHALHALGSRALGFSQEMFNPAPGDSQSVPDMAALAEQIPNLVRMLADVAHDDPDSTLGWCDDQTEFEFGIDLLLDGLDRLRPKRR